MIVVIVPTVNNLRKRSLHIGITTNSLTGTDPLVSEWYELLRTDRHECHYDTAC